MRSEPLRVCFVMPGAYPLFNPDCPAPFGGSEIDLYLASRELASRPGFQVQFLVGDYGQPGCETRHGVKLIRIARGNRDRYPLRRHRLQRRWALFGCLLRCGADVLVTQTAADTLLLAAIAARLRGMRVVHKCASAVDVDFGWWRRNAPLIWCAYAPGMHLADAIVCQTTEQYRGLAPRLRRRAEVIPGALPAPAVDPQLPRAGVLWVGRADDVKRVELVPALAAALPEEPFTVIMPGIDARRRAQLVCCDNITVHDRVPFDEIMPFFFRAKCLLNTSRYEGFPNTFLQACMAGTPILSWCVNPDQVLDRCGIGCCCDGSVERAVAFVRRLDPATVARMGACGRAYAAREHDFADGIARLAALLQRVVAGEIGR